MAETFPVRSHSLRVYEGPDETRLKAWVELARSFLLVQRRIVSTLARYDLTLPQFDVLATVRFGEGLTQQELAKRLLVTKGNVCGLIDRLEAAGWVERRSDAKDRRANRLHLTPAGRRRIDAALPGHDATVLEVMRPLSVADAKALRTLLSAVSQASGEAG